MLLAAGAGPRNLVLISGASRNADRTFHIGPPATGLDLAVPADELRSENEQEIYGIARGPYAASVAKVDPDDDSIDRWVVQHYRYDPDRRERRHVVVAAFDNPNEFHADIEERTAQLRARKERGDDVDHAEYISGMMHQSGYRRLQGNAHLLKRAIEHGVALIGVEDLGLPSNVGFIRAVRRS